MKKIYLFEPSIASNNTGDAIIVEGAKKALASFLNDNYTVEMPTHTPLSNRYAWFLGKPDMKFVCGSNIITGHLNQFLHVKQWALGYMTTWQLTDAIFIGVGAQRYQRCNFYTRHIYHKMFNRSFMHSVRDAYTETFLRNIGINNVINTGCPTMWNLTPEHCAKIPREKADDVVVTLTDYSRNRERDEYLLQVLKKEYRQVFFWPQGNKDDDYLATLSGSENVQMISPSLKEYDYFLDTHFVDFVGTRLHGGIRALQHGRRTIIIGIDNRAIELQRDFNVPVLNQDKITMLSSYIETPNAIDIHLNVNGISVFLKQFGINYQEGMVS